MFCFVIIFPFMFFPAVISHGFDAHVLFYRSPFSAIYSSILSFCIVLAALLYNYNNLADRQRIFKFPAFQALPFEGMVSGLDSLIEEVETFVLGQIGDFQFRINVIEFKKSPYIIEIIPLISIDKNPVVGRILIVKHAFTLDHFLYKRVQITEEQLLDSDYLYDQLQLLSETLTEIGAAPLSKNQKVLKS